MSRRQPTPAGRTPTGQVKQRLGRCRSRNLSGVHTSPGQVSLVCATWPCRTSSGTRSPEPRTTVRPSALPTCATHQAVRTEVWLARRLGRTHGKNQDRHGLHTLVSSRPPRQRALSGSPAVRLAGTQEALPSRLAAHPENSRDRRPTSAGSNQLCDDVTLADAEPPLRVHQPGQRLERRNAEGRSSAVRTKFWQTRSGARRHLRRTPGRVHLSPHPPPLTLAHVRSR